MSVMTPDGSAFDAIVFGEQAPRQWLAGSDFFRRTKSFEGQAEAQAHEQPVHLAIAYHADGRIVGYRNGALYGSAYQSSGPQAFAAGEAVVAFGMRHLPAGGNRLLAGRIVRARLYDRALTADEIAASARGTGSFVSAADVDAAMTPQQRLAIQHAQKSIASLEEQLRAIGPVPQTSDRRMLWSEMARALFSFKEFIYLK